MSFNVKKYLDLKNLLSPKLRNVLCLLCAGMSKCVETTVMYVVGR